MTERLTSEEVSRTIRTGQQGIDIWTWPVTVGYDPSFPPPPLPGVDQSGETHFARDRDSGPLYVSKTILSTDPPALRLAYMPYPISLDQVQAFKESFPFRISERERRDVPYPFRAEDLWAAYQHAAMGVFWAFGRSDKAPMPPFEFCRTIANWVNDLYQQIHINILDPALETARKLDLLTARQRYQDEQEVLWRIYRKSDVRGVVMGELREVIGSAGSGIAQCKNCERFFDKVTQRRAYCSEQCRAAFNHQLRTGNFTISGR